MTGSPAFRQARIDLDAIRANVRTLAARIGTAHLMAVVKADGYGHGATAVARAALAGGADWLGVADVAEALALREAGVAAPVLAWLHDPDEDFVEACRAGIDIGVSRAGQLDAVARAAAAVGHPAAVQIKLDTGLSRNGVAPGRWAEVLQRAARLERESALRVRGVFTHVSNASDDDDREQLEAFEAGVRAAREAGLRPELLHTAGTSAALRLPEARYDLARVGIGVYGFSPLAGVTSAELGLVPAMTLSARVAAVRAVAAGTGVSYDYTHRVERDTTLALVPLGYGDGLPRLASGRIDVLVGGARRPIVGRIAMDQFVVDVGETPVAVGDEVVLFGDPRTGAPSADEWAAAAETIHYEIVTGIGPRVHRRYTGTAV